MLASTVGYRFWLVRSGEHLLRGPYDDRPTSWPGPVLAAECDADRNHIPPAPGCICGVYADPGPEITRRRVGLRGQVAPHRLVTGKVMLNDAVALEYPADPLVEAIFRGRYGMPPSELRGSSARIIDLSVVDHPTMTADEAARLVTGLTATYDVPVTWAYDPASAGPYGARGTH